MVKTIQARRSIRKYTGQIIPDDVVKTLLSAAMSAPSAGNERPWEFILIKDRVVLDSIPDIHPYAHMLRDAQAAILICANLQRERHAGFWVQDCSAAAENLLLAAQAEGLGAVWLGIHPVNERVKSFKKKFGLPETVIPLCLIPFGYPAEQKEMTNRYDESLIHLNSW